MSERRSMFVGLANVMMVQEMRLDCSRFAISRNLPGKE
jgi:hypothetical protein